MNHSLALSSVFRGYGSSHICPLEGTASRIWESSMGLFLTLLPPQDQTGVAFKIVTCPNYQPENLHLQLSEYYKSINSLVTDEAVALHPFE